MDDQPRPTEPALREDDMIDLNSKIDTDSGNPTEIASEGDMIKVTYNNVRANQSTKTGKVVNINGWCVSVDTLDEKPDGTPITFKVNNSGVLQSTTGGKKKRMTHKRGSSTTIEIVDED